MEFRRKIASMDDFRAFSRVIKDQYQLAQNAKKGNPAQEEWNFVKKDTQDNYDPTQGWDFSIKMVKSRPFYHSDKKESKLCRLLHEMLNTAESWSNRSTQNTEFGRKIEEAKERLSFTNPSLKLAHNIIELVESGLKSVELNHTSTTTKSAIIGEKRRVNGNAAPNNAQPADENERKLTKRQALLKEREFASSLNNLSHQLGEAKWGVFVPKYIGHDSDIKSARPSGLSKFSIEQTVGDKESFGERREDCERFLTALERSVAMHMKKNERIDNLPKDMSTPFVRENVIVNDKLWEIEEINRKISGIRLYVEKHGCLPVDETKELLGHIESSIISKPEELAKAKINSILLEELETGSAEQAYAKLDSSQKRLYDDTLNSDLFQLVYTDDKKNPLRYGMQFAKAKGGDIKGYGKEQIMRFILQPGATKFIEKFNLTGPEAFGIHTYTLECYEPMNDGLRGKRFDKKLYKTVDYPENEVPPAVWHVNKLAAAGLEKIPGVPVPKIFRGITPQKMEKEDYDPYMEPGSIIKNLSFTSTSYIAPFNYPTILVISPASGRNSAFKDIRALSAKPEENESLGEPDSEMRVDKVVDLKGLSADQKYNAILEIAPDLSRADFDLEWHHVEAISYLSQV